MSKTSSGALSEQNGSQDQEGSLSRKVEGGFTRVEGGRPKR